MTDETPRAELYRLIATSGNARQAAGVIIAAGWRPPFLPTGIRKIASTQQPEGDPMDLDLPRQLAAQLRAAADLLDPPRAMSNAEYSNAEYLAAWQDGRDSLAAEQAVHAEYPEIWQDRNPKPTR